MSNKSFYISNLVKEIKRKIELPLGNVHLFFQSPIKKQHIKSCLGSRSIDRFLHHYSSKINEYYKRVHSWIPANPSKSNVVQALNQIYVYADNPEQTNYYVNTQIGEKALFEKIVSEHNFTLYLKGSKGIGKTIFLNHFFNNFTEELEIKGRNIVWYRVDASKVYDQWKRINKAEISKWGIDNYLKHQICYVTFNSKKTSIFLDIQDNKNNEFLQILTEYVQDIGFKKHPSEIINAYKKFIQDFLKESGPYLNNKLLFSKLLKDNLLVDVKILYDAIITYLKRKDYRILLVFDGIDNVDFLTEYELYKEFVKQLSLYIRPTDKPNTIFSKIIVALRQPAITLLKQKFPSFFLSNIIEKEIKPISPNEMLIKKGKVAQNPSEYFKASKPVFRKKESDHNTSEHKPAFEELENYDEELVNFSKEYIQKITSFLIETIKKIDVLNQEVNENNVITILFNNNYRAFGLNYINSFKMMNLSKERKRIREEYLLSESLILNGKMYLDTEEDSNVEPNGGFTPNLFWFPDLSSLDSEERQWNGLCSIRLLQTCWIRKYSITQLNEIMSCCFGYKEPTTNILIKILSKYGLVEVSYGQYNEQIVQHYKTTTKGKFLYYFTFVDFNCFYYFALDTPLHDIMIDNSKLVRCHTNNEPGKGELWQGYSEAAILTSLTLIRHIKYCHENETINVDDKKEYLFKLGIDISNYNLPFEKQSTDDDNQTATWYKYLLVGMTKQINSMAHQSERIKDLKMDIEGIISQK